MCIEQNEKKCFWAQKFLPSKQQIHWPDDKILKQQKPLKDNSSCILAVSIELTYNCLPHKLIQQALFDYSNITDVVAYLSCKNCLNTQPLIT